MAIAEDQTQIAGLLAAVRYATRARADWGETAELFADALRRNLPGPELLTPEQRLDVGGLEHARLRHGTTGPLPSRKLIGHRHSTFGEDRRRRRL